MPRYCGTLLDHLSAVRSSKILRASESISRMADAYQRAAVVCAPASFTNDRGQSYGRGSKLATAPTKHDGHDRAGLQIKGLSKFWRI